MKYGDEITTKLEELAISKVKSPKEWEFFKNQVLHSFMTAEKIGNRNANPQEHKQWEERLIKLGILERKIDIGEKQEVSFKEELKNMASNKDSRDDEPSTSKVLTEAALQKNAEQIYVRTGMLPIGYKKDEKGKIVKILPKIETSKIDRLSAGNNLSATKKQKPQELMH